MTTNVFARLKRLLPDSTVFVARVVSIDTATGVSTLELPTGQGIVAFAGALIVGSTITARGTSVPIGSNAFVRDGVIESQAPDATPLDIVVGRIAPPFADPLVFTGPIPDAAGTEDVAFGALPLAGYWSDGWSPVRITVGSGALPDGLELDADTGIVSGMPTAAGTFVVTFRAVDAAAFHEDSNPTTFVIA